MTMRRLFAAAVIPAALLAGCGRPDAPETPKPGTAADAEMDAAIWQARAAFPQFVEHWKKNGPAKHTLVKVFFPDPAPSDSGETMWVSPTSLDADPMRGTLISKPVRPKAFASGQEVAFTTNVLVDWVYVESNRAVGAFTIQLERRRMSAADRQAHDGAYPFSF